MRELLDAGLLHGDCVTVTGKTVAENLAALDPPAPDGDVVHPLRAPIHTQGGLAVLTGSLAPNGSVVKVAGIDELRFDGTARVFDGEDARDGGDPRGPDQARRRRRDPLRGSEGRPGDARDARDHRRDEGRGPRRRRRARHRRSLLRRDPRLLRRSRRARSRRRRPDRARRGRRPHRDRRRPRTRSTCMVDDAELERRRAELEAARAALHERVPRQVRAPRAGRRARRDHEPRSSRFDRGARRVPEILEVESARQLIEARALGRPIASRCTRPTPGSSNAGSRRTRCARRCRALRSPTARRRGQAAAGRHRRGAARRRLPVPVLALHLGHERPGPRRRRGRRRPAPLREQRARTRRGTASVCASPTAARCSCATRAGSAPSSSTPTRTASGPTRSTLTLPELRRTVVGRSRAPLKAVLMDQARIAGLGNLLVDEILWRAGLDPARPADSLDADEQAALHRAIRTTLRVLGRRGGSHTGDLMAAARARRLLPPRRHPPRTPDGSAAARPTRARCTRSDPSTPPGSDGLVRQANVCVGHVGAAHGLLSSGFSIRLLSSGAHGRRGAMRSWPRSGPTGPSRTCRRTMSP